MADLFLELSEIMTGFDSLPPKLGALYQAELENLFPAPFKQLLEVFAANKSSDPGNNVEAVGRYIWGDPALQPFAAAVTTLWYNAVLDFGGKKWVAPPEAYFESLLWKAVDAHPPALSGGYFGYWRYAPEN